MPAGVLPEARRRTIPLTDQGAKGGRELGVLVGGPIVAPRRQIFLPDVSGNIWGACRSIWRFITLQRKCFWLMIVFFMDFTNSIYQVIEYFLLS